MESKNHYEEALRYIDNAKKILKESAGKNKEFYTDGKYVSMACNTAWSGILIALHGKMIKEGVKMPSKEQMNVNIYREYLTKKNKTILKYFNSSYNHLHLLGGYDKELSVSNTQTGLDFALKIIEWCK